MTHTRRGILLWVCGIIVCAVGAIIYFQSMRGLSQRKLSAANNQAFKLAANGDTAAAENLLRRNIGRYFEADELVEQVAVSLVAIANRLRADNQTVIARRIANQAVACLGTVSNESAGVLFRKGVICETLLDSDSEAITYYNRALDKDPNFEAARSRIEKLKRL